MRRLVLQQLLTRRPFKPFRITLSNQEAYDVRHPEAAYLAKLFIAVVQPPMGDERLEATGMVWIDYKHVVHCQPLQNYELPF